MHKFFNDRLIDAQSNNWVDLYIPKGLRPYFKLSRLDRPIGSWLLIIPCWWGIFLSTNVDPTLLSGNSFYILIACYIGGLLMRGAGCTWNDITDANLDAKVLRTKNRPIPAGHVSKPQAFLWLILQCSLALAILITQFSNHFQNRLLADGKNIDVVVGAKGSPLQLILSSVYHVDIPTGNIPFKSVESIIKHPQVKNFIPLALGDNWKGFRIVGTSYKYLDNYEAELKEGRLWNNDFEVIVGSSVNISINEEFSGAHGLFEGGNIHDDTKYKVVGILKKTGTVLDRLILTSVNSVLALHDHEGIEEFDKMNEQHIHDDSLEHKEHHDTHKHEKPVSYTHLTLPTSDLV